MMKSISGVIFSMVTSGTADTNYSNGFKEEFSLYSKSPNALDKPKEPFTLLSSTNPFAFSILAFSEGVSGLWSTDKSFDFPFLLITDLQSPALAQ